MELDNSRQFLGLKTCTKLYILHIANTAPQESDSVVTKLVRSILICLLVIIFGIILAWKYTKLMPKLIMDKIPKPKQAWNTLQRGNERTKIARSKRAWGDWRGTRKAICTNLEIVPKPHKSQTIHYCSDMRMPITAIKRSIIETMTIEDIIFKLEGAPVFSVFSFLILNPSALTMTIRGFTHHEAKSKWKRQSANGI